MSEKCSARTPARHTGPGSPVFRLWEGAVPSRAGISLRRGRPACREAGSLHNARRGPSTHRAPPECCNVPARSHNGSVSRGHGLDDHRNGARPPPPPWSSPCRRCHGRAPCRTPRAGPRRSRRRCTEGRRWILSSLLCGASTNWKVKVIRRNRPTRLPNAAHDALANAKVILPGRVGHSRNTGRFQLDRP